MSDLIGFFTLLRREIARFMKVYIQTILPPIISAVLFIIIFGYAIGSRIQQQLPVSYLEFIIPGLIMMGLINNAYANTSSSLYISRWQNHIHEILVSPISYFEMALAYVIGGVARGVMVAIGVYIATLFIKPITILNPLLFIFFIVFVSIIFSSIGVIIGLWAETFDQISILTTFVLTPLIFLGGVFHSITFVPSILKNITLINPIFYMVDGIRYSMLGIHEARIGGSIILVLILAIVLFTINIYLFKKGYKLRS